MIKARFINFRRANRIDIVISDTRMQIKNYENLRINIKIDGNPDTIELFDVAYIPQYLTNLISVYKAEYKRVYWDQ